MVNSLLLVTKQVLILFILIGVGYILGKTNMITKKGSLSISHVVMYAVIPCMMVHAFQRPLDTAELPRLALILGLSALIHVLCIFLSGLLIHDEDDDKRRVLRFASVFSNCGFMGFPLMTAILGSNGVFYGSVYVVAFQVVVWTWGFHYMGRGKEKLTLRPILLNPGVIGVTIALILYLLQITLPEIISAPVEYLSQLNTPLPMIVVGFQLSQCDLRKAFKGVSCWVAMVLRLVIMPLLTMGICLLLKANPTVAIVAVIAASTPAAANTSMFAENFDYDTSLASSVVSSQTLCSIITMPLMIALAQFLFSRV